MFTSTNSNAFVRSTATLALAFASLAAQAAHANNLNPVLGGGLGAMAGALIGQSVGGRDGALIGAAVGGVAGVSIASDSQRRYSQSAHNVGYQESGRPAPVVVHERPYQPAPAYGYREVERVTYYPVHDYSRRGWGAHERGWQRHDEYRRDWGPRGAEQRGWDRRD
jgi:hypothetical protein